MLAVTRLLNSLLYGLGRAAHGSWGQIGVQLDGLQVFFNFGVFTPNIMVVFTPLCLSSGARRLCVG